VTFGKSMLNLKGKKRTLKILVDSNALFVPFQFKIDIFEELKTLLNRNFELVLLFPIHEELELIANKDSPKMRKQASSALKLAEKCTLYECGFAGSPDDAIVKMAREWNCIVFTNDRELRKRLRNINVPVIYVRQKSRLGIDGRI
jgi:rRNA-processing protein FCF1